MLTNAGMPLQVILRQVFEATEEALATPQRSPRPTHTAPYPALPMLPYPSLAAGSASGAAHDDGLLREDFEITRHQQASSSTAVSMPMSPTRMEHLSRRSLAAGGARHLLEPSNMSCNLLAAHDQMSTGFT